MPDSAAVLPTRLFDFSESLKRRRLPGSYSAISPLLAIKMEVNGATGVTTPVEVLRVACERPLC